MLYNKNLLLAIFCLISQGFNCFHCFFVPYLRSTQLRPFNFYYKVENKESIALWRRQQLLKAKTFDNDSWMKWYQNCDKEEFDLIAFDGPKDIKGTLYRNVHGRVLIGKDEIKHPFDADGMIAAITFVDGKAFFRNRMVRTKEYELEKRRNRILFRGIFGTQIPGGIFANIFRLKLKNVANTNVIYHGGRLLALWEAGLPHRLEPDSLRTVGKYTFKGALKPSSGFTAHPKFDSNTGNMVAFAKDTNDLKSPLRILEFDNDLKIVKEKMLPTKGFSFNHDFAITKNYYLFINCPLSLDPIPFVLGLKGASQCMGFDSSRNSELVIVPRNGEGSVRCIDLDPFLTMHISNAYEEDGKIVLDIVRCNELYLTESTEMNEPIWKTVDWENDVPFSSLYRYEIVGDKWSKRQVANKFSEFPVINQAFVGKKYKYAYLSTGLQQDIPSPWQTLMKMNVETGQVDMWSGGRHDFMSEATFAPKTTSKINSDEDDGYVLVINSNTEELKSQLLIFEAKHISKGPIYRWDLPVFVPAGLHGSFVPDLVFDPEETKSKFKAFSALDSKNWNKMSGGFSGLGIVYELDQ